MPSPPYIPASPETFLFANRGELEAALAIDAELRSPSEPILVMIGRVSYLVGVGGEVFPHDWNPDVMQDEVGPGRPVPSLEEMQALFRPAQPPSSASTATPTPPASHPSAVVSPSRVRPHSPVPFVPSRPAAHMAPAAPVRCNRLRNWSNHCFINSSVNMLATAWAGNGRLETLRDYTLDGPLGDALILMLRRTRPELEEAVSDYMANPNAILCGGFPQEARDLIHAHQEMVGSFVALCDGLSGPGEEILERQQVAFLTALVRYGQLSRNTMLIGENCLASLIDARGRVQLDRLTQQDVFNFMGAMLGIFGQMEDSTYGALTTSQTRSLRRVLTNTSGSTYAGPLVAQDSFAPEPASMPLLLLTGDTLQEAFEYFGSGRQLQGREASLMWPEQERVQHGLPANAPFVSRVSSRLRYYGAQPPQELFINVQLHSFVDADGALLPMSQPRYLRDESLALLRGIDSYVQIPMQSGLSGASGLEDVSYVADSFIAHVGTLAGGTYMNVDLTGSEPIIRYDTHVWTLSQYQQHHRIPVGASLVETARAMGWGVRCLHLRRIEGAEGGAQQP